MTRLKTVILLGIAVVALNVTTLFAQQAAGTWNGSIQIPGQNLSVTVVIDEDDNGLTGTLDIPLQRAKGLPLENISVRSDSILFDFNAGPNRGYFTGVFESPNKISGTYKQGGAQFPFTFEREPLQSGENESDIDIKHDGRNIGGTLVMPESGQSEILVIMISGSGAQDRNSEVMGFGIFETLADELKSRGIASFRYDDRSTGTSTGSFAEATLDDLAMDVIQVSAYFTSSEEFSFDKIVLYGHSQGGMVATRASVLDDDLNHLVLSAAPVMPLSEVLVQQIRDFSSIGNQPDSTVERSITLQRKIYDEIQKNGNFYGLKEEMKEILRSEINKLPPAQKNSIPDVESYIERQVENQLQQIRTPQMRSFLFYPVQEELRKSDAEVLFLFGGKDIQVSSEQNAKVARELMQEYPARFDLKIFPNANHLFQKANTGLPMEYGNLPKTFTDGFVDSILEWMNSI